MRATIDVSYIRSNLRLMAEMGKIPAEMVGVVERGLMLDFHEEQFKKFQKSKIKSFGKAMAELFEEFDVFIDFPFGQWEIISPHFRAKSSAHIFDAQNLKNLHRFEECSQRTMKRIKEENAGGKMTAQRAKEIIAEENLRLNEELDKSRYEKDN